MRRLAPLAFAIAACGGQSAPAPAPPPNPPPYPESDYIGEVSFDWDTHRREAQGSDNWPVTWAKDGHQYTAWGDGFGFDEALGKISLGFSRISGDADSYTTEDLFYGDPSASDLEFDAKSYGIIALDGMLYAWLYPGSEAAHWRSSRLYRSDDRGHSWHFTGLEIAGESGLALPWFLQAGRNYGDRPDEYFYIYFLEVQDNTLWDAQTPGLVALARVPLRDVEDFTKYEFFAGRDTADAPVWTSTPERREPVVRDQNGLMRGSMTYVPGLDRFLFIANHTVKNAGNLALFEGDSPWGPWRTVLYEAGWGSDHVPATTFYWTIAPGWLSDDGQRFVLVFTGKGENDSWNTVEGRFHLRIAQEREEVDPPP